jgi:hypothetical protein
MVSCDVFGMEEGIQVAFGEPVGGQASGLGAGGVSDTLGSGAGRVGGPVDLERGQAPRVNYLVLSSTIGGGMIVSVPKGDSRTIENGP